MSKIHYFQRYHQKENVVTNNTLLLFSRLYNYSPKKFKQFIDSLLDKEINVGVDFFQQLKGTNSIPDGFITQQSFKIVIETKLHNSFDSNQITNHLSTFRNEETQILLALSNVPMKQEQTDLLIGKVREFNESNNNNVNFISVTFRQIIEIYKQEINDFDLELKDIIDDFEDFCSLSGLLPKNTPRMLVVPCGQTLEQNKNYNVYYDPADRSHSRCTHLGIYRGKRVQAVGKIVNIIVANYNESINALQIIDQQSEPTETQKENIISIINDAKERLGWNLKTGHKFFCVDDFFETHFAKNTTGGIMGKRYFDLFEYIGVDKSVTTEVIAEKLKLIDWEKNERSPIQN